MSSGEEPSTSQEVWKLLGRDNPAGRALFAIYNGDFKGKSAGTAYHQRNKAVHEKKLASGWTPPPKEPPPRPAVEVPKVSYPSFPKRYSWNAAEARLAALPHRRPAAVIQAEIDAENERMRAERPAPRGPLLDDREKDRLASMMRFRGKVPSITPEQQAAAAKAPRAARSEQDELQDMFSAVVAEIEDRQQWLRDMEAMGALNANVAAQVRSEIRERVKDMERLDQLINK